MSVDPLPRCAPVTPLVQRLRAKARPLVVAHRGLSSRHPENTLPSFAASLDVGTDLIELDVHETADGVVVCIHDDTLDRTTDAGRRLNQQDVAVRSVSSGSLRTFDAGAWFGVEHAGAWVPTLEETIAAVAGRAVLMIEHKGGDPAQLVAVLRRAGVAEQVIVQSFDWAIVAACRRLAPELTLGALGEGELTPARLAEIDALGVHLVHWHHTDLRVTDVAALGRRGYLSCVYTVDSELEWLGCRRAGVDAITTNRADRLRDVHASLQTQ